MSPTLYCYLQSPNKKLSKNTNSPSKSSSKTLKYPTKRLNYGIHFCLLFICFNCFCLLGEVESTPRNLRWGMRVSTKRSVNTASDFLFPFISHQSLPESVKEDLDKYSRVLQLQKQIMNYDDGLQDDRSDYRHFIRKSSLNVQNVPDSSKYLATFKRDFGSYAAHSSYPTKFQGDILLGKLKVPLDVYSELQQNLRRGPPSNKRISDNE